MIIGIGNDVIDIRRIEKILIRHGDRFIQRVFTDIEQDRSKNLRKSSCSYAKRFAAKEACAKALGTGIACGVSWKDIGVINLLSGKPVMELTNCAQTRLQKLLPPGHDAVIHLSITDDFPWAQAFVIIEALPRGRVS
ncbi:4'-phosphopantetheinyl transferase [Bartonella australis AUST/NH1]|uniref:Holo-[acyl-carrier-protein] synthase n=1 Tax=Bartonella australis (strain Aust/NH1) TaxID=1094489 RepID=M1P3B1_BARAA|nr:holo-ACP synthase [Bartonella australis]AGF74315.1 4'-phosphopantetheinyl transferase [Bartonella australis AUST/NH1]